MNPLLAALVQAGVISQADAERINRSLDPDAARVWAEQQLVIAAQNGLSAQQERLLALVRRSNGQLSAATLDAFWDAEDARLWAELRPTWEAVTAENAVAMAVRLGADARMWNAVNERMLDWVDAYYMSADAAVVGSIPNLNLTSRTQFGQVFDQWQRGELEVGTTAEGLPQLVQALEPVFGPVRSEVIAATEYTRIAAESTLTAARDNETVTHLRYYAVADERVCSICGPNHGATVPKDSRGFPMPGGHGFPPLHPRCRCAVQPETDQTMRQPLPPEERWTFSQEAYDQRQRDIAASRRQPDALRTLTGG